MRPIFKAGNVVSAVLDHEVDYMLHVTNSQRVMNSGVAKEVRNRIPEAYEAYMATQVKDETGCVTKGGYVYNMAAQQYYGYDKRRYLDYGALAECLFKVREDLKKVTILRKVFKIGIPHHMGSDRAGGDWDTVLELVIGILGKNFQIVVYKLEEEK